MSSVMIPKLVRQGEGEQLWVVGFLHTILAEGADTNGAYAAFDVHVPPQSGTPPHVHTLEDEAFFILEGQIDFTVDGRVITAPKNAFVHAPRDVPHFFTNNTDGPARMIILATPAGIEDFFREVGVPAPDPEAAPPQADPEPVIRLAPKYGMTIFGPPE